MSACEQAKKKSSFIRLQAVYVKKIAQKGIEDIESHRDKLDEKEVILKKHKLYNFSLKWPFINSRDETDEETRARLSGDLGYFFPSINGWGTMNTCRDLLCLADIAIKTKGENSRVFVCANDAAILKEYS